MINLTIKELYDMFGDKRELDKDKNAAYSNNINFSNQLDMLFSIHDQKKSRHPLLNKIINDELDSNKISDELLNLIKLINTEDKLVYAAVAPAFLYQFDATMTTSRLRSVFKSLGFTEMIEVALFADILTLREALEFIFTIDSKKDFMLTSCCCPMWVGMLRKNNLLNHMPGSVSPMIACGRTIKKLYPDAIVVFIGPCIAKKAEAKEKDLIGAVDYVFTFKEMEYIVNYFSEDIESVSEDMQEQSSLAGRIYARTGGVSEAVKLTVNKFAPEKKIITHQANGVIECKKLIDEIKNSSRVANFFEGMGCVGGCVGGPKRILDKEVATKQVNEYGKQALYQTPIDNPYVVMLLQALGFIDIKSFLDEDYLFTRNFT
jgi:iron only hydrogenase large subunit-like protein